MEKIVVTTGQPFTDIDALACTIAYTALLNLRDKNADAVLPGPLNKSVTPEIISWGLKFSKKPSTKNAKYILVDISDPKYFASFVNEKGVVEIFDHRPVFENYWKEKLGKYAHIEMVGACATLIWEEYKKRKLVNNISTTSAKLLVTAIISNTLNFKAGVTTERDKVAFRQLLKITNFPKNWVEKYFEDQEKEAMRNPIEAIKNDSKGLGYDFKIGQLEFWDSKKFVYKYLKKIEKVLTSSGNEKWFFTSPSISEGKNYLFTKNEDIKKLLEDKIDAKFDGHIGVTKKLLLRKEILQKIGRGGQN